MMAEHGQAGGAMGEQVSLPRFHADYPIAGRSADRLGRRGFAEALAKAVLGWGGEESLVIGLYGPWGSGKSSIKNMAVETLAAEFAHHNVRVTEFNPWQVANRDQLTEVFFREIGRTLGTSVFPSEPDRKRVVAKWRAYGSVVRVGVSLVEPIKKTTLYAMLMAAPFVQVGITYFSTWFGIAFAAIVTVAAATMAALPKIVDSFTDAVGAWQESKVKPLQELKRDLSSELRRMEGQLLVVIDDLDRLVPDETLELLQLVKANADFPKVVYLMLCDRSVVEKGLDKALGGSGRSFLEKIVQVSFSIPRVDQRDLDRLLSDAFSEMLGSKEIVARLNSERWARIYIEALRFYLSSPRNVYRFISTVSFHLGLFGSTSGMDVDVVDLLALEVLRLFEPELYQSVSTGRSILTDQPGERVDGSDVLGEMVVAVTAERKEHARRVLEELFPLAVKGSKYSEERATELRRDRRVALAENFDRYFQFALRGDDLRHRDVEELLEASSHAERFVDKLHQLRTRGLLDAGIRQLEAHKESIGSEARETVIEAMCEIGDWTEKARGLVLDVGTDRYATEIVWGLLQQEVEEARKVEVLKGAIKRSAGILVPILIVEKLVSESVSRGSGSRSVSTVEELKRLCVEKLLRADAQKKLRDLPHLGFVLGRWREWGQLEDVRNAARQIVQTPQGALRLCEALSTRSIGSNGREVRVVYRVVADKLEELVPLESIDGQLKALKEENLDQEDRLIVAAFRTAFLGGGPESGQTDQGGDGTPGLGKMERSERPKVSRLELESVVPGLASEHMDVQVAALERLGELAFKKEVESREEIVRLVEEKMDSEEVEVRKRAVRVVGTILNVASGRRKEALAKRFLPKVLELLSVETVAEIRTEAQQAATFIPDPRVISRLIELIGELPEAEVPANQAPSPAYALKLFKDEKDAILAKLAREGAKTSEQRVRERYIKASEVIRSA